MKKWLLPMAALAFLAGCQDEAAETPSSEATGPAEEIETKIEEALGTDVSIPMMQNHDIGLAYLDSAAEDTSAHLIYQTTTKPADGFNIDTWSEQNEYEVLHGDLFKDAPLAELDIFPETFGELADAETQEIAGQDVAYKVIPGSIRDTAVIGFDKNGAGYMITYYLAANQTIDEAFNFAEKIIEN